MYINKGGNVIQFGTLAELDLSGTGVAGPSFIVMSKIQVKRLVAMVSTVLSSTVNAVVTFRLRPTFASASGQSVIGTLGVGTAGGVGAVGTTWYKNITPVAVNPGSQIVTDVTTAATTSGKCVAGFEWEDQTEEAKDITAMNLSVV